MWRKVQRASFSSSVNSESSTWPAEVPIACFYLIEGLFACFTTPYVPLPMVSSQVLESCNASHAPSVPYSSDAIVQEPAMHSLPSVPCSLHPSHPPHIPSHAMSCHAMHCRLYASCRATTRIAFPAQEHMRTSLSSMLSSRAVTQQRWTRLRIPRFPEISLSRTWRRRSSAPSGQV